MHVFHDLGVAVGVEANRNYIARVATITHDARIIVIDSKRVPNKKVYGNKSWGNDNPSYLSGRLVVDSLLKNGELYDQVGAVHDVAGIYFRPSWRQWVALYGDGGLFDADLNYGYLLYASNRNKEQAEHPAKIGGCSAVDGGFDDEGNPEKGSNLSLEVLDVISGASSSKMLPKFSQSEYDSATISTIKSPIFGDVIYKNGVPQYMPDAAHRNYREGRGWYVDSAEFMVNIGLKKVLVKFRIVSGVSIVLREAGDTTFEKVCPNGYFWKIYGSAGI